MGKSFCFRKYNQSWGHGMSYESEKAEKLMTGSNQAWYDFKRCLIEHISCSSIKSAGQVHLKAKQYAVKENKMIAQSIEINTNLIAAAIAVNKTKSAATSTSYETIFALMAFSGSKIGDIGHGR